MRTRVATALVLLTTVVATLASVPGATAVPTDRVAFSRAEVVAPVPELEWSDCDFGPNAECAKAAVPLDYDDPDGATTGIAVARIPASDPEQRIGSLFVNPGGPGGASREFVEYAARTLGPEVRARFDIVGADPRGIGGSGFAACHGQRSELPDYRVPFPLGEKQTRVYLAADRKLRAICRSERSRIVDHMTTADVARDMDLLRQAMGDEQLTYYGISYGSYLGATYAAMFPDRVRAVTIDGVLDPIKWSTGTQSEGREDRPVTYRLRSGKGAYESLTTLLVECDRVGRQRCRLAGDALGKWQEVYAASRRGDLRVGGSRVSTQDLVGNALSSLYSPLGIPFLIDFLVKASRNVNARGSGPDLTAPWAELERIDRARDRIGPYGLETGASAAAARKVSYPVQFQGVLCADSRNPSDPEAWVKAGRVASQTQPWFGQLWNWSSSVCANWPGSPHDAYRGPWRTTTSTPLLVIGNTHDPATPITGARTANRVFEDSVMVTLDQWAHGAIGESQCIANKMTDYLVEQRLPSSGIVCQPDERVFANN